ncbi:MAG: HAD-IA family hydrolase [Spirochaetales bacterium]|nr:HAD-IA family hydrolase [Spirochaetales bacterium]
MKCILFDHDGTLMNSLESVVIATNRTMAHYGSGNHPAEEILMDLSSTTHERVSKLTGITEPDKVAEMVAYFYTAHTQASKELTRPYPGVCGMLKRLKKTGIAMGIVSNCRGDVVREIIEINGLSSYFPVMLGEEEFIHHKPEPAGLQMGALKMGHKTEDCLYIGDGMPDYLGAKAAGMRVGMVTWGNLDKAAVKGLSPDYIFESPEEIAELFSNEPALV